MLRTWFSTVFSAMNSCSPISRYVWPRATYWSTSRSRSDSGCTGPLALARRRNSPSTSEASDGENTGSPWAARQSPLPQLLGRRGLHQVADRTGGHRVEQVALGLRHGQHHDPGLLAARLGDLDAAAARHVEVADDEVGLRAGDHGDGLVGVAGLADDVEVAAQVGAHPAAPDRVVVGQHHAHGLQVCHGPILTDPQADLGAPTGVAVDLHPPADLGRGEPGSSGSSPTPFGGAVEPLPVVLHRAEHAAVLVRARRTP